MRKHLYSFVVQPVCANSATMKKFGSIFVITAVAVLLASPALASCGAKARAMIAGDPNAEIVSVQPQDNNGSVTCVVRIKIKSADGKPPRIVTRQFKL